MCVVYVCVCVCMYVYVCVRVCVCVLYVCVHAVYVCVHAYVNVCVYVCVTSYMASLAEQRVLACTWRTQFSSAPPHLANVFLGHKLGGVPHKVD